MWLNKGPAQGSKHKAKGLVLTFAMGLWTCALFADPGKDQQAFRAYYQQKFPQLSLQDYASGVYAIDAIAKQSWLAIEEFPPYEPAIEQGKVLFETPFQTGDHYADCFPDRGIGITNDYPQWDRLSGEVVTLVSAINRCRIKHQKKPLLDRDQEMVNLLAYMSFTSRGKPIHTVIPDDDPRALMAYEKGKQFYYQRRGQLNFACATCHVQNVGKHIRSELLSPSLGHTSGWPTYRLKWGEIGTLHRRFSECLEQIKAGKLPTQSEDYRNLEYFLSFMANGIAIVGPSTRK